MLVVQCLLVLWCTIHVNVFVCYKEERSIIQNKMESLPLLVFKMMGKGVLPLQIQIVNIDSHKFYFLKIIV